MQCCSFAARHCSRQDPSATLQVPHSPLLMEALPQLLRALVAASAEGQPAELLGRLESVVGRLVKSYALPQKGELPGIICQLSFITVQQGQELIHTAVVVSAVRLQLDRMFVCELGRTLHCDQNDIIVSAS